MLWGQNGIQSCDVVHELLLSTDADERRCHAGFAEDPGEGNLGWRRILHAVKTGEMTGGTDASVLAGHTMAVIQGMSTLARNGASREKLLAIADAAMKAFG